MCPGVLPSEAVAVSSPGWASQARRDTVKDVRGEETSEPSVECLECTFGGSGCILRGKPGGSGSSLGVMQGGCWMTMSLESWLGYGLGSPGKRPEIRMRV